MLAGHARRSRNVLSVAITALLTAAQLLVTSASLGSHANAATGGGEPPPPPPNCEVRAIELNELASGHAVVNTRLHHDAPGWFSHVSGTESLPVRRNVVTEFNNGSGATFTSPSIRYDSGRPASDFLLANAEHHELAAFPHECGAAALAHGEQLNMVGIIEREPAVHVQLGYDSSRTAEPVLLPPGGGEQTITITITLQGENFRDSNFFSIWIDVGEGDEVVSQTPPSNFNEGESLQPHPQPGRGWNFEGGLIGKTYSFETVVRYGNDSPFTVRHTPAVQIYAFEQLVHCDDCSSPGQVQIPVATLDGPGGAGTVTASVDEGVLMQASTKDAYVTRYDRMWQEYADCWNDVPDAGPNILELPAGTPGDGFINPANGHLYRLSHADWHDAQTEAEALGGDLVTLNDAAEEEWVRATFGRYVSFGIGFNDMATEGTFVWTSGEPATYTNWCDGEPNDANLGEDVTVINACCPAPPPEPQLPPCWDRWVWSYTIDFEPGDWTAGEHSYHQFLSGPASDKRAAFEETFDIGFTVDPDAPLYPGEVRMGPGGLVSVPDGWTPGAPGAMPIEAVIHPEQDTFLQMSFIESRSDFTLAEVEAYADTFTARLGWDDQGPFDVERSEVTPGVCPPLPEQGLLISDAEGVLRALDQGSGEVGEFHRFETWGNFDIQYLSETELVGVNYNTASIYRLDLGTHAVTQVHQGAPLINPIGIVVSPDQGTYYIADQGCQESGAIFAFDVATGTFTPLADQHPDGGPLCPDGITLDASGRVVFTDNERLYRVSGGVVELIVRIPGSRLNGVVVAPDGDLIVASHEHEGNVEGAVYRVDPITATVTSLWSGFPFRDPEDVALDLNGDLYLVDSDFQRQFGDFDPAIYVMRGGAGEPELLASRATGDELNDIVDLLLIGRPAVPTSKDDCMDGGWRAFGFENQGQCIRSVVAQGEGRRKD